MRRTTKSKAMSVFLPVLCFAFVYVAITQVNLVRRQQRQKTVALKHFNQNFSDSKLSTSLFPSSNFDQLSGNVTRLNRREKTKTKEVAPTVTAAAYISGRYLRKQVTLQTSPVSSQLTCKQLKLLMNKTRKNANSEFRYATCFYAIVKYQICASSNSVKPIKLSNKKVKNMVE